jgi:hypothetical protein
VRFSIGAVKTLICRLRKRYTAIAPPQRAVLVRKKTHANPTQGGQHRAEKQIVSSPCPENWECVGEDAGERLQIPCQRAPKECCHLLACDVDVILEEELQRQPSQHQRLRQCRGENAVDDDKTQRKQIALVDFCTRARGFAHFGLYLYPELEQNPSSLLKSAASSAAEDARLAWVEIAIGLQLTSVRELTTTKIASQLGVSTTAVRRALRVLHGARIWYGFVRCALNPGDSIIGPRL